MQRGRTRLCADLRAARVGRRALFAAIAIGLLSADAAPVAAFIDELIAAPKTLFDRAIEARSSNDIVKDNQIVIDVNAVMADLGTIKASTEIYEQRLLVTGLFDDKALYDRFQRGVKAVKGVRKLYWHVTFMDAATQKKNDARILSWTDALALDTNVGLNLVGDGDVADVNFRVAVDAFGAVYLIGRARSKAELAAALKNARETEGVKKVVNYVAVRP